MSIQQGYPEDTTVGTDLNQVLICEPGYRNTYVVKPADEQWSWCNLVTAACSYFCCSCFGLVALILALLAYTDHKAKDFARSKHKRNLAMGFSIAAIVIGSLAIVGVLIMIPVALQMNAERGSNIYEGEG